MISILFSLLIYAISALPVNETGTENTTKLPVFEVEIGSNAVLLCHSNEESDFLFFYWHVESNNAIIGPSNNFDITKYDYEILDGNLTVKGVIPDDEGIYNCASRGTKSNEIHIRPVRLMVNGDWDEFYEHDSKVNSFRLVLAISSGIIGLGLVYVAYVIWKDRFKNPTYLEQFENEEDADIDEDIFSVPSTSKSLSGNIVKEKAVERYDNNISTDFNSILDSANK